MMQLSHEFIEKEIDGKRQIFCFQVTARTGSMLGVKTRKFARLNGYKVCGGLNNFKFGTPQSELDKKAELLGWPIIHCPKGFSAKPLAIDRAWGKILGHC